MQHAGHQNAEPLCRFPVILFTLFNLADLGGKSLPMWGRLSISSHVAILQLSLARILFIPAFALAAHLAAGPWGISVLSVLLGVTNGYATAVAMVAAPVGLQVILLDSLLSGSGQIQYDPH